MICTTKSDNISPLTKILDFIFDTYQEGNMITSVGFWKNYLPFVAFIMISVKGFSSTVHVSPTGSDSNNGTFETPFQSLNHALDHTGPGDTIYMLAGRYDLNSTVSISSSQSGTEDDTCYLFSYENDSVILDFTRQAFGQRGISLSASYWYIKGLIIINSGDNGMHISGHHNRIEHCIFSGNDDSGLQISNGGSHNKIINCDSYNNADPDNVDADGFAAKLDIGPGNEFYGCRSWNNSDDGWDLYEADDSVVIDNCWTFRNGYLPNESESTGEGNGFKLGGNYVRGNHLVKNSIVFDNKRYGFHQNNNIGLITIYNSIAWDNSRNFNFNNDTIKLNILTNNISFNSGSSDKFDQCDMTTNSWQGIMALPSDFISLLTSHAKDRRMPDGSLPPNTFCRLAPGSNLIDKGTNIGYGFAGTAPDLGPFELMYPDADMLLNITSEGNGGVWMSPPGGTYDSLQEVNLIAWAGKSSVFKGWSGDLDVLDDTVQIVMENSKSLVAHFNPSQEVNGDSIRIEAENMVLSGYIFERFASASNGKIVRPTNTNFCSGHIVYDGETSWHRLRVVFLDADNGVAQYRVTVNDNQVAQWEGDYEGPGTIFSERIFYNIYLSEDDILSVESKLNEQEYGKIDYIELIKSPYIPENNISNNNYINEGILYYPNPFTDKLTIQYQLNQPSSASVKILNIQGMVILSETNEVSEAGSNYFELNTAHLIPGFYLVRLITIEDAFSHAIVIKK